MKKLLLILLILMLAPMQSFASDHEHSESSYRNAFCSSVNGERNVYIGGVKMECATNTNVYEIEFADGDDVFEGTGKIIYNQIVSGKKATLVLIVEYPSVDQKYVDIAKKIAKKHGFEVKVINKSLLKLDKSGRCENPKCDCRDTKWSFKKD